MTAMIWMQLTQCFVCWAM